MKRLLIYILLLLFSFSGYGAITYNSNEIIISGTETGNSLRSWLASRTFLATVVNSDITFYRDLKISSNASFTDENAVYHFPNSYRYEPQSNCTVTLTDVTLHYSGSPKNHTFNYAYTANFTRVSYLQGVTSGRSDFFNNGNYNFNMSNVSFVSYGSSDYLHFQSSDTLYNIIIVNKQGALNFEPGAVNASETEVIYDLQLKNVTQMVGGAFSQGDFKVYNLDWDATNWRFSQRSVDFLLVNPIKPNNWNAYTGSFSRVKEYYTHDVKLVDTDGLPVANTRVLLINDYDLANNSGYTSEYDVSTNAQGVINQQEILKINNSLSSSLRNRGDFTLAIADYHKKYQIQNRNFNQLTNDILLVDIDGNVSNTNESVVSSYSGIGIDHNTKELIISSTHTLCELYDYIKYDKVTNNITKPTIDELLVQVNDQQLYIGDYKLILQSGAELQTCDKFNTIKSDEVSTIGNTQNVKVALEDPNGLFKMILLNNIQAANLLIKDNISGDTLVFQASYTGQMEYITQLASTDVLILVSKPNFSNWVMRLDLSQNIAVYQFEVNQTEGVVLPGLATSLNQEEEIYLLQKLLQKSSAILKSNSGNTNQDPIQVNTVSPTTTDYPTQEKQEESLELLRRILSKVSAIKQE